MPEHTHTVSICIERSWKIENLCLLGFCLDWVGLWPLSSSGGLQSKVFQLTLTLKLEKKHVARKIKSINCHNKGVEKHVENVHYSNKATESAPGLHSELWIIITVDSVAQNLVREKHLFLGKKSSRCCELSDWLFDERSSDSVIGALLVSLAVQC